MFNKERLRSLALTAAAAVNPKRTLRRGASTAWNLAFMYATYEALLWFDWKSQTAIIAIVVGQVLWTMVLVDEIANRDTLARDAEYWQERAHRAERILNVVMPRLDDLESAVKRMKNQPKGE